jgi:hypothetical protein
MSCRAGLLALTLTLLAPWPAPGQTLSPRFTQGASADWRTVETEHFRVHYPAESEAWARRAAVRLESIRERVAAEVGYTPTEVVDVLVSDPVADPNGMAFPFLGWPRMVLWTSPPGPESVLGHYRDWGELLIVHEDTHLVHLLRPSRNPVRRLLSRAIPVGPIALGAPRWVSEGYATVVEGRLTGAGRPHGDVRASVLRRWAQTGKLPSYGRLASDPQSWQGLSMAYLLGSAYLEWLEERTGPGSLRNLWARMTARETRSFEEAFRGVFGDSPANLYDRFRAELTASALEVERRVEAAGPAARREGEMWQDLTWTTGAPDLSPDGERLAIVLRGRDEPTRLVVWSTDPNEKAETEWKERQERILERDPEDVPAVRNRPLPREPLHTLAPGDDIPPTTPRWMPDGRSILFVRFEPDAQGFLHPDLFLWSLEDGEVKRLTREADLRLPDPSPDGTWAVAVRNRHGLSQVVRVDLRTGGVEPLTEPSVEVTYDSPRISPDGRRVAFARHREGSWRLILRDLASGAETALAPPGEGTIAYPAWSADGAAVYAAVGDRGFIDVWAFPATAGSPPERLTRTQGAALAPEPTPDGSSLFYLNLDPAGLDLYRFDLAEARRTALAAVEIPANLVPAIPPPAPERPEPFRLAEVPADRPYGIGRQELYPLLGGSTSSSGGAWEIGVRGGDVVGRLGWLALGSISADGWPEGGALAATWRGWPVTLGIHAFSAEERPSEQRDEPPVLGALDLDRQGVELSAGWERLWSGGGFGLDGRFLWNEVEPREVESLDQNIASLAGSLYGQRSWGSWRLEHGAGARYESGSTEGSGWARFGGGLRLGFGHDDARLRLSWRRDSSEDLVHPFDLFQLGGPETSLLPGSALSGRIAVPALPVGTLLGEEHEGQRVELLGLLPVPLFYERHRLWSEGAPRGDWLELAGVEWRLSVEPIPIGRIPALDLRAGLAQVLEGPFEDETRGWLIAVWRP